MSVTPNRPSQAPASHASSSSAAGALAGLRGGVKPRAAAGLSDDDEDGGFAAQLLRAQPADAKSTDADGDGKSDGADKANAKSGKDDQDDVPDAPPPTDPNALLPPWMQALAPSTTSLATRGGDGPAGLRKPTGKGKDDKDAGLAALGTGKDAAAQADGARAATDPTAALAKVEGAGNFATHTRDAMAALLPEPDPVAVQAGAIGAAPTAVLDANQQAQQSAPSAPAQATLPMLPQSPTFAPALGQQIETWMRDGVQHAEVQLSPQDLGPIRVRIAVEGASTHVEMHADVASTREALQQAMPQLSDSLGQIGLTLTGGGVSDQSTAQSQSQDRFQAMADGGNGGGGQGRPGRGGAATDLGAEDFAIASAARQAAQRRGLLDMYA